MFANPLLSGEADSGLFYGRTDQSTSGSPIESVARAPMNDHALTGSADVSIGAGGASGKTNVYVGALVLAALAGLVAFHYGGFDAHLFLGRRG